MVRHYTKNNNPYKDYYRGRYMIALYEGGPLNDEWFFREYDNISSMAMGLNMDYKNLKTSISKIWKKERRAINYRHKYYTVHFIDMWDDDED